MDNSFQRQGSGTRQPSGHLAQVFDRILKWLVGLVRLTEEELEDAGIYLLDRLGDE